MYLYFLGQKVSRLLFSVYYLFISVYLFIFFYILSVFLSFWYLYATILYIYLYLCTFCTLFVLFLVSLCTFQLVLHYVFIMFSSLYSKKNREKLVKIFSKKLLTNTLSYGTIKSPKGNSLGGQIDLPIEY